MNRYLHRGEYRHGKNKAGWVMSCALVVFIAILLCYVWQKMYLSRQLSILEHYSGINRQVSERLKELAVEEQQLSFRGRIEQVAESGLGLCYPEKDQLVALMQPPRGKKNESWTTNLAGIFVPAPAAWGQQ